MNSPTLPNSMLDIQSSMEAGQAAALTLIADAQSTYISLLPWWMEIAYNYPILASFFWVALLALGFVINVFLLWGSTYLFYVLFLREKVEAFFTTSFKKWMREMRFEQMPEDQVRSTGKAVTDELIRRGIIK